MVKKNEPHRHWCITINNYTDDDIRFMQTTTVLPNFRYLIAAKEVGAKGTPHIQAYTEFEPALRRKRLTTFYPRARIEKKRENSKRIVARNYCWKGPMTKEEWDNLTLYEKINLPPHPEAVYTEFGEFKLSQQGKRTDLEDCRKRILEGESEETVSDAHFGTWTRYHRSFKRYKTLKRINQRNWKTQVIVLWGKPGTGKTERISYLSPNVRRMFRENQFWSDYDEQKTVLWDDFDGHGVSRQSFLQLTDRYPCQIRQIGGYSNWAPRIIYITSNTHPCNWYNDNHDVCEAVLRRIDYIEECFKRPSKIDLVQLQLSIQIQSGSSITPTLDTDTKHPNGNVPDPNKTKTKDISKIFVPQ